MWKPGSRHVFCTTAGAETMLAAGSPATSSCVFRASIVMLVEMLVAADEDDACTLVAS